MPASRNLKVVGSGFGVDEVVSVVQGAFIAGAGSAVSSRGLWRGGRQWKWLRVAEVEVFVGVEFVEVSVVDDEGGAAPRRCCGSPR